MIVGYARLYHSLLSNDKIQGLSAKAFWTYVHCIVWSSQNETDGVVVRKIARFLCKQAPNATLKELVDASLLEEKKDGFIIHDYLEHQNSKSSIEAKRKSNRERKRRERTAPKGECHAVTDTVTHGVSHSGSHREDRDRDKDIGTRESDTREPVVILNSAFGPTGDLDLVELERIGYPRFGALAGAAVSRMRNLAPIAKWEWEAVCKTNACSWVYVAKVLESMRKESAKGPCRKPRHRQGINSQFVSSTRMAMEWATDGND